MKLCEVTVRHPGSRRLLGPWTLEGPDDRPWLLMGPSGSGKTTLLKAITGRLKVGGKIRGAPPRDRTALLPQFPERVLTGRNLAEDLCNDPAPGTRERRRLRELLRSCGLNAPLHRDARSLSGGEKRRLLLAMVAAGGWRHWGLDEPEAGLDYKGRQYLLGWIRREIESSRGGRWIAAGSPWMYLGLDPFCVVLENAKVFASGTRDDMLDRADVWDRLGFSAHPAGKIREVIAAQFHNLDNNVWKKLSPAEPLIPQVQAVLRDSEVLY